MYVTELVVANTVNTMPEKTMEAFADHGEVKGDMVSGTEADAQQVMDDLEAVGISYDDVVDVLEREGVEKFEASWARAGRGRCRSRSTRPRRARTAPVRALRPRRSTTTSC